MNDKNKLRNDLTAIEQKLKNYESMQLKLDMSRGKPSTEQLDSITKLFQQVRFDSYLSEDGQDVRNYGSLFGIPEMRKIFAELLQCSMEDVWCISHSSLTIEYDLLLKHMLFPISDENEAWSKQENIRFLCPVPGYDRHHMMLEQLGIEMIPITITDTGIDMDEVEDLVANDSLIKGIWLVPMYSNPSGTNYSEETLRRLLRMQAASDFRIFADMAYMVHHLYDDKQALVYPLLQWAEEEGNPNRMYLFSSTSKITYAGGGIASLATSEFNRKWLQPKISAQMISADKVNQLRHAKLFSEVASVEEIMRMHADILRPKFECLLEVLETNLQSDALATWTYPLGGYFVSIDLTCASAKEVYNMCKNLGITLTNAGSCFPYGIDPDDKNLRLAPSYPSVDELQLAMQVFCDVVKYLSVKGKIEALA